MAYAEQWSTDPAQNTKAPPLGAPEGGLALDRVSDTFRSVMAGVAELLEMVQELEDNGVGNADDAVRFGGRTKQQWYNDLWPVGSERGWSSTNPAGLVPAGITATWTLVAQDCLLVGVGSTYPTPGATTGSGTTAAAASDGAHTHTASASASSTALTPAQVGSNLDASPVVEALSGTTRRLVRVVPEVDSTAPLSGSSGHTHSVSASVASGGAHTHSVTLPQRYATAWFRRTA